MLAARYHLTYWAAALSAAAVYQLLVQLPLPGVILACRLALLPLSIYAIRASCQWSFREKKTTDWHLYIHQAAVAHLLVAMGSVINYYQVANGGHSPALLLHTLFAFTAVGTLESLRQNRNDIEPRSLGLCFRPMHRWDLRQIKKRHPDAVTSTFRSMAAVIVVTCGLQTFLVCGIVKLADRLWGTALWTALPVIHDDDYQVVGRLGSALATVLILTPFLDMAETIYYLLMWKFIKDRPGWVRKTEALVKERYPPGSELVPLEIVICIWCWVPQVIVHWVVQLYLQR